jgi:phosphate transport system ATP-binding protein
MSLCFFNTSVLRNQAPLFESVSMNLEKGLHALVGPSGAGKSSLLLAAVGLLDPKGCLALQGQISLDDKGLCLWDPLFFRRQVSLVTQHPVMFFGSIADNICVGALNHRLIHKSQKQDFALQQLQKVGLHKSLKNRLHEDASILSLGQKQRVSFARSLAVQPRYLLLDEPTSALDSESAAAIEELLIELKSNMGIVFVSHNKKQVERLADECTEIMPLQRGETLLPQTACVSILGRLKKSFGVHKKTIAQEI